MRGRYSSADAVDAAKNQVPLIVFRSNKPMEKGRNGARYFRNPPQPHMCIQDYIEDTNEPCFINVLSWVKISTPRKPEDPIPLYGGMRVPHNSSAALSLSSHFGAKGQPVIFAVMANPEILRLSGKTAPDPSDRDALVELMIDFVEAMNPDIRFKRKFTVLRDRDLAGELKDIWLAVQAKRERERGENGRRGDSDRGRESKEDMWREEARHRGSRNSDREPDRALPIPASVYDAVELTSRESTAHHTGEIDSRMVERQYESADDASLMSLSSDSHLLTPSSEPSSNENIGSMKYTDKSVYSLIRSHYEQDLKSIESNTENDTQHQNFTDTSSLCTPDLTSEGSAHSVYSVYPECVNESQEASTIAQTVNDINTSHIVVQSNLNSFANYQHQESDCQLHNTAISISDINDSPVSHIAYELNTQYKGKESSSMHEEKSNTRNASIGRSTDAMEDHIFAAYPADEMLAKNKSQVPNMAGRSHEDLLPNLNDNPGVKFAIGTDQNTIAIP